MGRDGKDTAYGRQCSNWLTSFGEWVLPLSAEAPESYIFWSGLFALSSVLRRRVKIPQNLLGRWECPPHQYIMLVGPPGMIKTTSARAAGELLEEVGGLTQASSLASTAAIGTELVNAEDSSLFFICEEFSDLIAKSHGKEMYEFLTSMYDGKKQWKSNTISRGLEFSERPCINMLAATTPKWIASNMTEDIIGGGFASRVLFIFEDQLRGKKLFYKEKYNQASYIKLKTALIDDLKHIATLNGDFDIPDPLLKWIDNDSKPYGWYQQLTIPKNPKLLGYHRRKPAHMLKLAMLFHISYSDTLVLDQVDIDNAIGTLESEEINMFKVFEGLGRNPFIFDTKEIYKWLIENGPSSRDIILRTFESVDSPLKMDELLNGMIDMKLIKGVTTNGQLTYEAIKYK